MIKKFYISVALVLGLLSLSPAISLAQTQNSYGDSTVPATGNQAYGFGRMMPGFQAIDNQGQVAFSPMMGQYGYKTFGSYPYHSFMPMSFIVCAITVLMLWALMALAIVSLAIHLKKTLHKKE